MQNLIITLILLAVIGLAGGYVYRARKSGRKCIGCPHGGKCGSCSGCGMTENE